jgi:hypothetical protein
VKDENVKKNNLEFEEWMYIRTAYSLEVKYCNGQVMCKTRNDYGLDDRVIGVRVPAGAKDFSSSLFVQTQPPVQWVPGVLSPRLKRGRGVMLTTHPYLVPRSSMSRSYTTSPPKLLHGV